MTGIYLGGTSIERIYLGSTEIKRVFHGATQVWPVDSAGTPGAYAVWNIARPGIVGRVAFSNDNKTATLSANGSSEYGTAAMTAPVDFNASTKRYIELELSGSSIGTGPASSGSSLNASEGYLGESAVQYSIWDDSSHDENGGINSNDRPNYQGASRIKIYIESGKYWIGIVGTGWWNPAAGDFSGNPPSTFEVLNSFPAGLYSIAASTLSNGIVTIHADPAEWLDSAPSGSVPFTA